VTEILLDTSAYSAVRRGHSEIAVLVRQADRIHVNSIVLGELLAGFQRGKHRKKNEDYLRSFLASSRTAADQIDEETAERYAAILDSLCTRGTPIPTNDMWIAASAMQHGLTVVTTDPHYLKVSQVLVRCFDFA
jgi:predicted nucleic acid-binding protein